MPFGRVAFGKPARDDRDELLSVSHTVGVRPETLVRDQLGQLEHLAEQAEQPIVSGCDHQLAVAGGEDLVRRDHREHRSLPCGHRAVGEVPHEVIADVAERSLVERCVDQGSTAGSLTLEQRRDDAECGPHPCPHVDEGRTDTHTGAARLARHADQPAGCLHERVVPGLLGQWAGVAVGADRAVYEPSVSLSERVGAEAEAPRETGTQALEEYVGAVDESQDGFTPSLVAERHCERTLPRVHGEEHRALSVPERRAPGTAVVSRVGPLDLHDICAERREDLGAVRPGDRRRHVDHARAV